MRFRLVFYNTNSDDKFIAEEIFEYFGNRDSIWQLWFLLTNLKKKHVEIFNLSGEKCHPERGYSGMIDYNI